MVAPYFIEEDSKKALINISQIKKVEEIEAHILSRKEYDEKLQKIVNSICVNCIHFENEEAPNTHREKICLDGKCWDFEKKSE